MEENTGHKWYHGSPEALFAEIVAACTEKPGGDISIEDLCHHEHETFSTTTVQKGVMEYERF